jgi:hypothetical protein
MPLMYQVDIKQFICLLATTTCDIGHLLYGKGQVYDLHYLRFVGGLAR